MCHMEGITRTEKDMKEKAREEGTKRLGILDEGSTGDGCCYAGLGVNVDLALQIMKA